MSDDCASAFTSQDPQIVRGDMDSLVNAFPCLRGRAKWIGDDSAPFKRQMRGMSTGELLAAQFVLWVWNRFENKVDLCSAILKWDEDNMEAFQAWLRDPWWK